jgi:hypothetical protein
MLQEYHNTLCDSLNAVGCSHKRITLEDLWKEFDNKSLYGLYGACCVLPIALANKGIDIDVLVESGRGRENNVYNEDSYKKAMQRMLPIFEKKGAFRC